MYERILHKQVRCSIQTCTPTFRIKYFSFHTLSSTTCNDHRIGRWWWRWGERMKNKNKVKNRRRKRLQVIIHTIALAKQVLFFLRCSFVFGCSVAVIGSYALYLILIASYERLNWWRIQFSIRSWQRNISRSFRSTIFFFIVIICCMKIFCVWNIVSHLSQKISQNPFCIDRFGIGERKKT